MNTILFWIQQIVLLIALMAVIAGIYVTARDIERITREEE